ncbi:MAG: hypothetical protein ACYSX1_05380, partial [Planctomycetota bacterium]
NKPNQTQFQKQKVPLPYVPGGDTSAEPGLAWQHNYSREQRCARKFLRWCWQKIPFVTGIGRFGWGLLGFGGKEGRFEGTSRL